MSKSSSKNSGQTAITPQHSPSYHTAYNSPGIPSATMSSSISTAPFFSVTLAGPATSASPNVSSTLPGGGDYSSQLRSPTAAYPSHSDYTEPALRIEDSYEDYADQDSVEGQHPRSGGFFGFGNSAYPATAQPPSLHPTYDIGYGHHDDDNESDSQASEKESSNPLLGIRNPFGQFLKSKPFAQVDPLFQPLIESTIEDQDESIYVEPERRPYSDISVTFIYLTALLFMFVWGIVSATSSGSLPSSSIISKTLYFTFSESAVTVLVLTIISVLVGAAWLVMLSYFARPIIFFTAIAIPASIFLVSIITFFVSLSTSYAPKTPDVRSEIQVMMAVAFSGIIISIWLGTYIWRRRNMVDTMTHVIELSCDILHLNPSLFGLSVALMIAHFIFSVIWLVLFSRLFLVGSVKIDIPVGNGADPVFVSSKTTPLIAVFFVFVYFWTSSIFQNLEKTTVASVVGGWYFEDLPKSPTHSSDQTWRNFQHVSTKSFGSVALASLILGAVQTIKYIISKIRSRASQGSTFMRFLLSTLTVVSQVIDDISGYALVNTGLTGDPFLDSAYACTRLFRRNLILGLITQSVAKIIGVLGRVLVASTVGLAVFWGAVNRTSNGVGTDGNEWVVAIVSTIVPYYVMGVLTKVVENTIDATFICYLIDLDTNSCHCEGAHRIFSESLS
ncbi:hypothetical protein BDV3_004831 [Batrachochytrium dendrobatidis]|uniref:Protein PNS1 n=1 Tax=Batrachochytrium dendrobatidis (strain JEL423) TaxID=403673 RepID=A0A177WKR9_BATDL|nr:hypothetical protein QVD99_002781 [Batrachochytrium dendrobatidis]OAJ40295.1 hypothetical protein BDEG_24046 [Batrachochytrium dendrobatidis JEL423]